jgi:hypothetical protein
MEKNIHTAQAQAVLIREETHALLDRIHKCLEIFGNSVEPYAYTKKAGLGPGL